MEDLHVRKRTPENPLKLALGEGTRSQMVEKEEDF